MAHHAPHAQGPGGGFLPEGRLARALIALGASVLLIVSAVAIWAAGGFEPADAAPAAQPGTRVETRQFTLTPHEAVFTEDPDTGLTVLQVRADLVSNDTKPYYADSIDQSIEVEFPSGKLEATMLTVKYTRHPEGLVSQIQPDMPEEALLVWSLGKPDEKDKDCDDPLARLECEREQAEIDWDAILEDPPDLGPAVAEEREITLTIHQNVYQPGFTDQSERWFAEDDVAAKITLPVSEEG
ncbi:hypothetical protein LG943_09995 [Streptomonospora sp. S1-112]|uniref:Uncharacterized protein n=1 Tax=Streptomonospora mangrovi TaxID=2883123 RepID=A0A9X3SMZ9_9ACTN|nr:hypothetical protein [Streptomonospora mangrovi]MDA0564656.1 hypothetical protein [Streptomonospora mangrovi]